MQFFASFVVSRMHMLSQMWNDVPVLGSSLWMHVHITFLASQADFWLDSWLYTCGKITKSQQEPSRASAHPQHQRQVGNGKWEM